jgi:hypothetical protein
MKADRTLSREDRQRAAAMVLFLAAVLAVLTIKSFHNGWFEPPVPLELNGKPGLVFFTLGRGCECQMLVVRNAEAQLAGWPALQKSGIAFFRVDFNRRPDLARQYGVQRAPALVLLDSTGEVVWKQDLGLSDEAPMDLISARQQIDLLMK